MARRFLGNRGFTVPAPGFGAGTFSGTDPLASTSAMPAWPMRQLAPGRECVADAG